MPLPSPYRNPGRWRAVVFQQEVRHGTAGEARVRYVIPAKFVNIATVLAVLNKVSVVCSDTGAAASERAWAGGNRGAFLCSDVFPAGCLLSLVLLAPLLVPEWGVGRVLAGVLLYSCLLVPAVTNYFSISRLLLRLARALIHGWNKGGLVPLLHVYPLSLSAAAQVLDPTTTRNWIFHQTS